jgi:cytidyltransferase-like protein
MTELRVLSMGYFDPLHRGHVQHFKEARKLGRLIVIVHRDPCCVKKKGYCFMPIEDRLEIIRSLRCVDEAYPCPQDCTLTASPVLERMRPDVFAKGGDRAPGNMPKDEIEACERLGIKIVYGVGGAKVQSSSWIINDFLSKSGRKILSSSTLKGSSY